MPLSLAKVLAVALECYVAAGLVFAVVFAWRGAGAVDPNANGATFGFRLLIVPGSVALWPWMLAKWRRAAGAGPSGATRASPNEATPESSREAISSSPKARRNR